MRRLIVDTSVLVAGLLTRDPTRPTAWFVDAMLKGRLMYLLSPALLEEYRRVLLRPKIRRPGRTGSSGYTPMGVAA